MYEKCQFRVQDVFFNAVLHRANEALLEVGHIIGEPTDEVEKWITRMRTAFAERFWDDGSGRYLDFDLHAQTQIDENTIATFSPLFAGLPTQEQAQRLVEHLTNPAEYWPGPDAPQFLVPTTSKHSRYWDPTRYWRGPVWVNTNWVLIRGLERYGFVEEANRVRDDTLSLLACPLPDGDEWWFWEYFNPTNGNVHGINGFSWSAALALELTEPAQAGGRPTL